MPRMKFCLSGLVLSLALGLAAGPVRANLVSNGDFGTGDFQGWTLTGSGGGVAIDTAAPYFGNTYDAAFALANGGTTSTLSQNIATTAGQSYSL